jgi:hypothetical protein
MSLSEMLSLTSEWLTDEKAATQRIKDIPEGIYYKFSSLKLKWSKNNIYLGNLSLDSPNVPLGEHEWFWQHMFSGYPKGTLV